MNLILKSVKNKLLRLPIILLALIALGFGVYKSYLFVDNYIADHKIQSYHWKKYEDKRIGIKFIAPEEFNILLSAPWKDNSIFMDRMINISDMELTENRRPKERYQLVKNKVGDGPYDGPFYSGITMDIILSNLNIKNTELNFGPIKYPEYIKELHGAKLYSTNSAGGNKPDEKRYTYFAVVGNVEYEIRGLFPNNKNYANVFEKILSSIQFTNTIAPDIQNY